MSDVRYSRIRRVLRIGGNRRAVEEPARVKRSGRRDGREDSEDRVDGVD